jgi:hypothetical protein
MKITLNVFLAVVLFCSVAFAGDMGNGGRPGGDDPAGTSAGPTPSPVPPPAPGDMGNGGRPSGNPVYNGSTALSLDSLIVSVVGQYLGLSL